MTTITETASASVTASDGKDKVYPDPTPDQLADARQKGVLDAVQESAKKAYLRGDDAGVAPAATGVVAVDPDVFQLQPLLDLPVEGLTQAVAPTARPALADGKVAGLLEMERSGRNRTDFVKALCARLGVADPREVTDAGPPHTNDTTSVSRLGDR